jgi:hypothetical protein
MLKNARAAATVATCPRTYERAATKKREHISGAGRLVAMLTALMLGLIIAASPAAAATVTRTDARGDAPARYDITRVTYTNTSDKIAVRIKLVNLRRVGMRFVLRTNTSFMGDAQFVVVVVRRPGGSTTHRLFSQEGNERIKIPCQIRSRWAYARDVVRISMPQTCLGEGYGDQRMKLASGKPGAKPCDWVRRTLVPLD